VNAERCSRPGCEEYVTGSSDYCSRDCADAVEDLRRLGLEAKGICPDTGLDLWSCVRGPCDCFLTLETIGANIARCHDELEAHGG